MRTLLIVPVLALAACGGPPSLASQRPLIDMQGVDPVKYNRDLAQCENRAANTFISFGHPTEPCIRAKGYRVLR